MKFKRKKVVKYRGSKTHGGGAMKKRRGAGNRGGRGRAGSGKRGDAKKPTYQTAGEKPGKYGFVSKHRTKFTPAINIKDIEKMLQVWQGQGKASNTEPFKIDLTKLGFGKLLSTGKTAFKFEITIAEATEKAVAKIEAAGGKVVLPAKKAE